jgi:MSHA biogenesis protein MshQ
MNLRKIFTRHVSATMVFACCLLCMPVQVWAVTCAAVFSNGIQTTASAGNVNLSYHSLITGGSSTLMTKTLSDNAAWVACSGSSCLSSGTPAPTSTPTFVLGTSVNGNINIGFQGSAIYGSGDYGTVTVGQQGILKYNTNNGVYLSKSFTTNFSSDVWLRAGDYWIDGNLTLGQQTILRRISTRGTTRIFVRGDINMAYNVTSASFNADQLLIYATGKITAGDQTKLSAFIYAGGDVNFGFQSTINGAVSGANFISGGNEITVNYQGGLLNSASLAPFCPTSVTIDHYELEVASTSLACLGANVTVRACANSASPCTLENTINTNVTLATSAGALDVTTLTLASGVAATKLKNAAATDGSTATVTLSGEQTAALNSRKCCTGSSSCVVANSCNTTFNTAGFIFSNTAAGATGNIPTEIAGTTDNNVYLRALQTNTTTGACTARFTSPQVVPLAYQCRNPTTCVVGQSLTLNSTAVQNNANAASPITYTNVSLNFDNQGTAPIPLNYSDVGQIRLWANLVLAATTSDPAYTMTGTSNDFVVKPYTLAVSSVQTSGAVANPGGTSAAGAAAGFVSAGTNFQVKVEARNSAGAKTPNFGNEISSASNIQLNNLALIYPAGGNTTPITLGASFSATAPAGTFVNNSVSWSQVGSFTVQPRLFNNDYLAAGDMAAITTSPTIGRIYPDHYRLTSSQVLNSCLGTTNFSYMSQPTIGINYVFQAESTANAVVSNYGGNYATAATIATPSYVAEDNDNGINLGSRFSLGVTPTWVNGVMTATSALAQFSRETTNTVLDGPYTKLQLGIDLIDLFDVRSLQTKNMNATSTGTCSGVTCTAVALGAPTTLNMRFGRLRLDDAFGPETVALPVNFVTEYWTGNHFSVNTDDSCTVVARSIITYPGGNIFTDSNRTVALTGGTTQGVYASLTATNVGFSAGAAGQYFTAPTSGGTGSFIVQTDLTTMPWLRFDWNQDGNFSDIKLPNANFGFGSYRGNDRVIYWREKLQ